MLHSNNLPFFQLIHFIMILLVLILTVLGSEKTSCFAKPNRHQSDRMAKYLLSKRFPEPSRFPAPSVYHWSDKHITPPQTHAIG